MILLERSPKLSAKLHAQRALVLPYVSRAVRALVHHMPCALNALVSHVSRALRALVPYVLLVLRPPVRHVRRSRRVSVPYMARASRALILHVPHILHVLVLTTMICNLY